jgi:hypothetical protein
MSVIKSVSFNQQEIISGIMQLCGIERFDVDLTYGNGKFWSAENMPENRFDIDDSLGNLTAVCSSVKTPLGNSTAMSAMFDPPFLTYVRESRNGNGNMVMAKRFSGYWRYDELAEHYRQTAKEAARILAKKGIFVVKCQDIIHNHKMHCTHANMIEWCAEWFRLKDLFVLPAKHRMPSPNRIGSQKHARIFHSYFLVFERNAASVTE